MAKAVTAEWELPYQPVYHAAGFSFPLMPVITNEAPAKVQGYNWGLVPHWADSLQAAQKLRTHTLNARGETLFQKPAFRSAAATRRCIVLADGFFEWMEYRGKKYPHYIYVKDHPVFGFAGVYSHWADRETGELLKTFSIVTTEANSLMARIHNVKKRMPVILQPSHWAHWLQPSLDEKKATGLLVPFPDSLLQAHTISRRITDRGADTNVPDIFREQDYPELHSPEQTSLFDEGGLT